MHKKFISYDLDKLKYLNGKSINRNIKMIEIVKFKYCVVFIRILSKNYIHILIRNQTILKWVRLRPGNLTSVTNDFTRLTIDTIVLCAMDLHFYSFYHDKVHLFIDAMVVSSQNQGRGCRGLLS